MSAQLQQIWMCVLNISVNYDYFKEHKLTDNRANNKVLK